MDFRLLLSRVLFRPVDCAGKLNPSDWQGYGGQEPLQWIGPGKIFESDAALDQFCKDHGFVDHFEIKSRDWISGEKSVFGQTVNCLLDEIFQSSKKERV